MSVNILVPEVGESIVDARVAKWLKKEGDAVSAGDPLVELETDQIDLEVSAPQSGVLERIDHQDGADVKVGDVLGAIAEGAGNAEGAAGAEGAEGAGNAEGAEGAEGARTAGAGGRTRATPTARKAAQQHAVDLASVKGSGEAGRVMRRDVESAAAPGKKGPGPAAAQAKQPEPARIPASAPLVEHRAPGDRTE